MPIEFLGEGAEILLEHLRKARSGSSLSDSEASLTVRMPLSE